MTTYYVLRILHLLAMAVWVGAALWVPGDVKRSLAAEPPRLAGLGARIRPALKLDLWSGAATLVTGVALTIVHGHPRTGIIVGFVLALLLFILVMTIVVPAGKRIAAIAESGGDVAEARRLSKSLAAMSGVAHLLWVLALVAMVLPY